MQSTYRVAYAPVTHTPTVVMDELVLVECQVTNQGSVTWRSTGSRVVNLAYRWLDASNQPLVADGRRTMLPKAVAPQETITCELWIEPPPIAGEHTLEIDMVAEQVAWFRDLEQPTLRLPVTVTTRDVTLPQVCIINANLLLNDAVSNNVMDQMRYFHSAGYAVTALVEHCEDGLPHDIRRMIWPIHLDQLQDELKSQQPSCGVRRFQHADIFIYHYPIYYSLVETISTLDSGSIIFDYHGVTPPQFWDDPNLLTLIIKSQERAVLANYADRVVVHSTYMIEELYNHSGFDRRKATVIPYVVPIEQFTPQAVDPEILELYGLHGQFVLLYIGRMAGNKKIDDLVRILAEVRNIHPNTILMLVGNNTVPAYRQCCDEALSLAAELGCADQVIMTGAMPHSQLHRFYNACHVYVTASQHEGFCVPVIEAMACGRPVVATDAAALPDTVGPAGLLFPPGDAVAGGQQVLRLLESLQPYTLPIQEVANG